MNITAATERFGARVLSGLRGWGGSWIFLFKSICALFTTPIRFRLYLEQVRYIGVQSLAVIILIGGFTGAVLAVQGEYSLSKFGATAWTGPMVALSLIRELAPVLTALMVIGRAGSAITAEIGIMKITEQIDALRSMAVDPIKYLMTPRIVACTLVMPLLMAVFTCVGIWGGYLVAVHLLGLSAGTYLSQIVSAIDMLDVYSGLIKALVFGFLAGWIACFKGFHCRFGAVGVNRATTESVVTASVAVLVTDYFLTSILTRVFFG